MIDKKLNGRGKFITVLSRLKSAHTRTKSQLSRICVVQDELRNCGKSNGRLFDLGT